jgi:transcriptional regulator with XRE-family HTH domain
MRQEQIDEMHRDWAISGLSIRSLAKKYGISASRAHRMMSAKKSPQKDDLQTAAAAELSAEVAKLKEQLRKERLKNELLNNIIDIADKELGTNIRKKSGTRQSE